MATVLAGNGLCVYWDESVNRETGADKGVNEIFRKTTIFRESVLIAFKHSLSTSEIEMLLCKDLHWWVLRIFANIKWNNTHFQSYLCRKCLYTLGAFSMEKALAGTLSEYFLGTFSKQGEWREQTQVSWKLSRLQIETFVFYFSAAVQVQQEFLTFSLINWLTILDISYVKKKHVFIVFVRNLVPK